MNYIIREIKNSDFQQLIELYTHLHEKDIPEKDERVSAVWESILTDRNHHIIVAEYEGKIISSCVCVIIPNLTRNLRPYAFVENVVTHADYRGNGIATACLDYARDIAKSENCYKLMLLTGSKNENTLNFYRRAGYNSEDKTAFIQWLE